MPTSKQYESLLDKQIQRAVRKVLNIYNQAITDISLTTYMRYGSLSGITFNLDSYPFLKRELSKLTRKMQKDILKVLTKSIEESWGLSNDKNNQIAKDIITRVFPDLAAPTSTGVIVNPATSLIFNPNGEALKAFTKRVADGMNLSDRVWRLVKPFRYELEAGLTDGINKGKSAARMAADLKKYLKEPERLFRRVRDKNGKLQLSKAAKEYHPGQGIYRSSFQNALRLTGSETNMAYRTADNERWNNESFVRGIEVKTSNNHPKYDICDEMAGEYPKDFLFRGWHPRCRCYQIPILITDDEFSKQEDVLLGLSKVQPKIKQVSKIPKSAENWISDNAERMQGWKNLPYWVSDNPEYVNL